MCLQQSEECFLVLLCHASLQHSPLRVGQSKGCPRFRDLKAALVPCVCASRFQSSAHSLVAVPAFWASFFSFVQSRSLTMRVVDTAVSFTYTAEDVTPSLSPGAPIWACQAVASPVLAR